MWIEIGDEVYNTDHVVRLEKDDYGNAILKCDDNCRYGTNIPYKKLKGLLIPSRHVPDGMAARLREREDFFQEINTPVYEQENL